MFPNCSPVSEPVKQPQASDPPYVQGLNEPQREAVLTSEGPVLFAQLRHGFNGETIRVMKFRSMYVDKITDTPEKVQQACRNDPRIT